MYPKQLEAIFYPKDKFGNDARYSFVEASTKTGKTVSCIAWLFEQALLGQDGQNYWWVAPVYRQAEIAYTRLKHGLPDSIFETNEQKLRLRLKNGACIWHLSADRPDDLYGEDVYAAVMDEASRAKKEAFYAVRSTLTATRGALRCIGNVKGKKNWFYDLARRAEKGEPNMAFYRMIAADAVHAGVLSADEVEDARRLLPDAVFKELYLAEASDDEGNPFGASAIKQCIYGKHLLIGKPVAWGIDLAKSVDWTVVIGLDAKGNVVRYARWQGPWEATITKIVEMIRKDRAPTYVDSTGVGDPIVERLQKELGSIIEGYHFSQASKQKLMEGLAVSIQKEEIGFPEGAIPIELDSFEYTYTRTGVRYTSPEGEHDDCVCALALANMRRGVRGSGSTQWANFGKARF